MDKFICKFCENTFKHNRSLKRHVRMSHQKYLKCIQCDIEFKDRKEYFKHKHLINHVNKVGEKKIFCTDCKTNVLKSVWLSHTRTNNHKLNCAKSMINNNNNKKIKYINNAFKNRIVSYLVENDDKDNIIVENFFLNIKEDVIELIKNTLQKHLNIKINFELFCNYILHKENEESNLIELKSHQTKMIIINSPITIDQIQQIYNTKCEILNKKMSEFQERDSGWALTGISHLEININEYKCLKGSQYIPLPPALMKKRACINVHNNDEFCFKWAIISALHSKVHNTERCSSYNIGNIRDDLITVDNNYVLNFKHLNFPLAVNKIKEFEQNNAEISINVFGLEDNNIVGPYYFTKEEKTEHINLLLLEDGDKFHYIWIKNISR